jgi:hypothetical protein
VATPNATSQENSFLRKPASYPRKSLAAGYELDARWPSKDSHADHGWAEVSGLAIDRDSNVWLFHRGKVPVQVFSPAGKQLRAWGEGEFKKPHQIRIDREGNLWLVDAGAHTVEKRTPEGKLLLRLGTPGEPGEDSTHFNEPTDIAILPDGGLAVSDGYGNNRVVRFDSAGRFQSTFGKLGTAPGEFSLPHSIVSDSEARLYVADRNNARVQVFDAAGQFLNEWRQLMVPWGLWITPRDEIYVCGSSPMRWPGIVLPGMVLGVPPKDQIVASFSTDGRMRELWTFPMGTIASHPPGSLSWVHAIAVDPLGNLFLGEIQGRRAQKFRRVAPDDAPGQLANDPRGDDRIQRAGAEKTPPR